MAVDSLQASPGELILPKWQELIGWIRRQRHQAPGATITYGPSGAQVVFAGDEYAQVVPSPLIPGPQRP